MAENDPTAHVSHVLSVYNKRISELQREGRAKPDMIAYKELKDTLTPESTHGHVPGVSVGQEFNGRGELAILGIHKSILRGIDFRNSDDRGAYAIVMSGGYQDDKDEGMCFWYTGEGGQDKKARVQAADQQFKNGNLALRRSCEQGTAVRVIRGKLSEDQQRRYVYEGLYNVEEYKQEPSVENPHARVIKFKMVAIQGEATASVKVEHKILNRARQITLSRALAVSVPPPRKRKHPKSSSRAPSPPPSPRKPAAPLTGQQLMERRQRMLDEIHGRPGLVTEDISFGLETVPIPMFNTTSSPSPLPTEFNYVRDYEIRSPAVQQLCTATCTAFQQQYEQVMEGRKKLCALRWTGEAAYLEDGRLKATLPLGVHECGEECRGSKCQRGRLASAGVQMPLEVFLTEGRGWGVRCRCTLSIGTFVCCYIGEVILDSEADGKKEVDEYLFNLDHFLVLAEEVAAGSDNSLNMDRIPSLPREVREGEHTDHLVVDARNYGNVARWINHCCDPNLVVQPILMRKAKGALFYYTGLYTCREVEAGEELTYNYGYNAGSVAGRSMECMCGAENCCGKLL